MIRNRIWILTPAIKSIIVICFILSVEIYNKMTKLEQKDVIESLEQQMREAAKNLKFEEAMSLRDIIFELKAGENKWKTKKQK